MPLVAWVSGNLLRHPFFSPFRLPPKHFSVVTSRGRYEQEAPLPFRIGRLFLGLLALSRDGEVSLSLHRLLKELDWKLYRQDLCRMLERLARTTLTFEGSFYQEGRFVSRRDLRLVEALELPEAGRPLRVVFAPWVREGAYPVDYDLLSRLSPLAARLYLYFTFALGKGSFQVSREHLASQVPVLTRRQEERLRQELPEILRLLAEEKILSFEERDDLFLLTPGRRLERLKRLPVSPPEKGQSLSPLPGVVLVGREHAGKTSRLKRLRQRLGERGRLAPLYLPCLYSLTDWCHLNFSPEELKGLTMVEKRRLLVARAAASYLLVDDLERATGQKAQVVKECLRQAPRFAVSTRDLRVVPASLRLTLERRGFREVRLTSPATKDLSFLFLALVVIVAALLGHHEWVLGLMAARFFLRQPV